MALNDLPLALQGVIQQGYLDREFGQALRAKLGFRDIADREPFMAGVGETVTKTRTGLLAAVTTPMAPANVQDITSGLTPVNYAIEQYVLGIAQYGNPMMLNVATAQVAIDDLYLQNAFTLGENAIRSVDMLARNALFDSYSGGNTFITTTLGAAGTVVQVDDVRGFFQVLNSQGKPMPVSPNNTLSVVIGSDIYVVQSVLADGQAPGNTNPWMANLSFSGNGQNTSITPGGYSGTLTLTTNAIVADATQGNPVIAATAPVIMRPDLTAGGMAQTSGQITPAGTANGGKLTMQMILTAKATMSDNAVPPVTKTGTYHMYADALQLTGLYQDPAFQRFFIGKPDTPEYKKGVVSEQLGVTIIETNLNPSYRLAGSTLRRAIVCGQGALVEGVFTRAAYGAVEGVDSPDDMISVVDGIAHITREPIDALKQVVTQSWSYIGGFAAPTDTTTNPSTVPTATNAAYKRAAIIESL